MFVISFVYIETNPNIDELVKQCNNENDVSCNSLGAIYAVDIKLEQDHFKIPKYLDLICKGEWDRSSRDLACYWENAYYKLIRLGLKQNYFKAIEYFQKGCDKNNNSSCSNLKEMYLSGRGVKKYDNNLILYYQEKCNLNNASACLNLGILYKKRNGISRSDFRKMNFNDMVKYPVDEDKAKKLFSKACDLKEVLGCNEYNNLHNK
jgi:TPR repeat protein